MPMRRRRTLRRVSIPVLVLVLAAMFALPHGVFAQAPDPAPLAVPVFTLEIPADTVLCAEGQIRGGYQEPRSLAGRSTLRLRPGTFRLPTSSDRFRAELVEEVVLGGEQDLGDPVGPGEFRVITIPQHLEDGVVHYRFVYRQSFSFVGGRSLDLTFLLLRNFRARDGVPEREIIVLDERVASASLIGREWIQGALSESTPNGERSRLVSLGYNLCGHEWLPRWEFTAELADGTRLSLEERHLTVYTFDTTTVGLEHAIVDFGATRREVSGYWNLFHVPGYENFRSLRWILFDDPVDLPGVPRPIHGLELEHVPDSDYTHPGPQIGRYLDETLETIQEVAVVTTEEVALGLQPFVRGDVDADKRLFLTDALRILHALFGQRTIACQKSADVDDDGQISISDALFLMRFVFVSGAVPPAPGPAFCGADPTEDSLSCEESTCDI